jgi:hypothetical protein
MASKRDVIHLDRLSQMPLRVLPVNVTMPLQVQQLASSKLFGCTPRKKQKILNGLQQAHANRELPSE